MRALLETYRSAFRGHPREVWLLCAVMLVHRAGTMVLPFLGLYLTTHQGFSLAEAGRVLAAYGLGSVLGIALAGRWIDRIGFRPVALASLFSSGLALFLVGQVEDPWAITAAVALAGLCADASRPAIGAALAGYSPPELRASAFALLRLAVNAAMTLGPVLGGLLARRSYAWLFWIDGGTALLAGLGVLLFLPPTAREEAPPTGPGRRARVLSDRPLAAFLVVALAMNTVFFQVFSTLPLYLERERGFREDGIGLVLATNTLLIVLTEVPLVHALRRRPPLSVLALAATFVALGFGLLPWAHGTAAIVGTIVLWTVGEMLAFPVAMGWVSGRAPAGRRGAVLAVYSLAMAGPAVFAPVLGTWVYERLGGDVLWVGCLALGLLAALGFRALGRHEQRAAVRSPAG